MEKEIIKEAPKEISESIKLTRNSRGYGWEIRILSTDINHIEKLNNQMLERFGGEDVG